MKHKACNLGSFQKPDRITISNPNLNGPNGYSSPAVETAPQTMRQREQVSAHRNDTTPTTTTHCADTRTDLPKTPEQTGSYPSFSTQKATALTKGTVAFETFPIGQGLIEPSLSRATNKPLPRSLSSSPLAATKRYQTLAPTNHSCAAAVSSLHTQARPLIVFLLFPRLRH